MQNTHSSPAVVLRWRAYGESDKIVTFLTRDFGKITGIGKGARNSRRRFPNSLESLARVQVNFRQRPDASLAFLESCELATGNTAAFDAVRLAYGAYLAELAERFTAEWNPVPELYELLDGALAALQNGPATASFIRAYELQLLQHTGFGSPLEHCQQCGRDLDDARPVYFSAAQGRFWCGECRSEGDRLDSLAGEVVARLRELRATPLAECRNRPLGQYRDAAAHVTGRLIAVHLLRPLQSVRMIEQLAAERATATQ